MKEQLNENQYLLMGENNEILAEIDFPMVKDGVLEITPIRSYLLPFKDKELRENWWKRY